MTDFIRNRPNLVVMAADPPWRFSDKLSGKRGAQAHYSTMSVQEIEALTLPTSFRRARNAVLFLWLVETMQLEALRVALAWGCRPYNSLVWNKLTKNGFAHVGLGRVLRGRHERCLVAVRGDFTTGYKPAVHDEYTVLEAKTPVGPNGKAIHSAKPDEFFHLVERLYPHADSKHEMFSRRDRAGWLCYGREAGKFNHLRAAP